MSNLRKLPDFTQLDLFPAAFTDIATRMVQDVMWRPFFALGKKPRFKPIVYKNDEAKIKIFGTTEYGIATIFDEDILMWLVSQVRQARDEGKQTSAQLDFTPYDCLKGMRRNTGGTEYNLLKDGLRRLHSTTIETSIRRHSQISLTDSKKRKLEVGFHWIEAYGFNIAEYKGKEVVKGITVVLPNWLYQSAIKAKEVLTINEDYLLLTSGYDRALYKIARKHVGRQKFYSLSMQQLYEKSGSDSVFSHFCRDIRKRVELNGLPEYYMMLSPKGCKAHCPEHNTELAEVYWSQEIVTFWSRESLIQKPLQLKSF